MTKPKYTSEELLAALKNKDLLSLSEVAALMGMSAASIRKAFQEGKEWAPPLVQLNRRWYARTEDYKAHLKQLNTLTRRVAR